MKPQILATAGSKSELYIYDVNDIENPFRLGSASARSDEIETLAWNRKVSHILATGGAGGFVTVWDLKTKKASLTLNNNRKPVSAIAWDPNNSTKLLTATPDDSTPVILLWDLRNSNAPERTLQGHLQGILSLSWCQQDSDLLLSSGKDNKTIVWNPQTGERLGEFPEVTNWTFSTKFNPHNPNLSATASFDGKITVQTLQNTHPDTSKQAADKNLDDEDFFRAAQTQPQEASWSLAKAPKWMERPVGASFGFGGKIVIFKANPVQAGQKRSSTIKIAPFSVDSDIASATEKFQEALASNDLTSLCEERMEQAKSPKEKADWNVMKAIVGNTSRTNIVEYLGFKKEEETNGKEEESAENGDKGDTLAPETTDEKEKKRLSNFFDGGEADGDDFLSNLASNKGAKTDNPFHLYSDSDTSVEKDVTTALMLGNFSKATDICLKEDRMADAFLIANCGGQDLVDKVQAAYLSRKTGMPSYLRLLGSVIAKNLWDVVYNADLENWKETMAIICTYSDPNEFPDLCEALGDRILESGKEEDASFCYLVGFKLEKVVSIWVGELDEAEAAGLKEESADSTFSVHARSLQNFIEKVTIFRQITKYQDGEKSLSSGWKLSTLYEKYTEYAEILASHGQLEAAQRYLDLLPTEFPAAEAARNRLQLATKKPAAQARQPAQLPRASSRPQQQNLGYQPPAPNPQMASAYGGYGQPVSPAPPAAQQQYMPPSNPYQPQGYQPPVQGGYGAPATIPPPGPPMGGPPRATTPSLTAAAKVKNMENWNDVPLVTKATPARRGTPSATPITSPFPGQTNSPPGPPGPGQYGQPTPPPPPPPKVGAPRVQSPLNNAPPSQGPPRPSSTANQYAPPLPPGGGISSPAPPVMPRTASPYNPPPAGGPPTNRYAPAAGTQQQSYQQAPATSMLPPASRPPPSGAYGAPPKGLAQQSPYAPVQQSMEAQAPLSAPPTGPPPMNRGPPPGLGGSAAPPPQATPPPQNARHPAGDRSHIPAAAQGLVDILSTEMQRVASKAPQSFTAQVKDADKRLNLLFDHLNNEELIQPETINQLTQLASAIQSKDYATAQRLQLDIQRDKTEECGNWMVRL